MKLKISTILLSVLFLTGFSYLLVIIGEYGVTKTETPELIGPYSEHAALNRELFYISLVPATMVIIFCVSVIISFGNLSVKIFGKDEEN